MTEIQNKQLKMSKGYGLILPGKGASITQPKADFTRPSIFASESDSDSDPPVKTIQNMGPGNSVKRQARIIQERALKEDPTVFQYDELYDDMETKRDEEKKAKSTEVKKPRYINKLLECAERRKIEYERRIERLAQKEREAEGDEFKDKESFVTSSYKKKLEELKKAEEREQREDYLEAIGDVTKQQDLGGFYRHLYEQKLGSNKIANPKGAAQGRTPPTPTEVDKSDKVNPSKSRAYRKRRTTEDEEENSTEKCEVAAKKAHLQSNLDADSDFSIDSSSDSEEENKCKEPQPKDPQIKIKEEAPEANPKKEMTNVETAEIQTADIKSETIDPADKEKEVKEKKPKKDIWKKRTVGAVFDAAFQRYCERKAARQL